MRIQQNSMACSLLMLEGFGEKTPMGYSSEYCEAPPVASSMADFREAVKAACEKYDKMYSENKIMHVGRQALIAAYTISTQPMAEKFLAELGFVGLNSGKYPKYAGHTATIWTMTIPDFLRAVNYKKS